MKNHPPMNFLMISPCSMPLYQIEEMLFEQNPLLIPKFETPTGLIELASYIRNKLDYARFEVLDLAKDLNAHHRHLEEKAPTQFESFLKERLDEITMPPDVVGLSVLFSSSYLSALEVAKWVREKWPETKIVFGGGHATFFHRSIFEDSEAVDYVFVGEAELGFEKLVRKLRAFQLGEAKDIHVDDIQGAYDRQKVKKDLAQGISKGVFGELLVDLDQIGLPAYDLLDIETYRKYSNSYHKGAIGVMMERGCPFSCTYCASMIIHGGGIRTKSNQRIIDDLKFLRDDCGFEHVVLWDDLLAARKKKFKELAVKINEEKVNEGLVFSMPSGLSVRIMDNDLIDSVCSLNFDYVRIMIESGSAYAQEHIVKKKVDLDKARDLIAHTRTNGVKVETNILFGFPGETKKYMQETIDYIKTIDVDWIQVFALLPLPGTEAYNRFVEMGKLDPENIDWDRCGYSSREFDTVEITADELTNLVYDVNIYTNFFGNRNLLQGRYERAAQYFSDMVLQKYDFHIPALYQRAQAYEGMGKSDEAQIDLNQAANLIKTNETSRGYWQRFGSMMPKLNEYLEDEYHLMVRPTLPSVEAGFVFEA